MKPTEPIDQEIIDKHEMVFQKIKALLREEEMEGPQACSVLASCLIDQLKRDGIPQEASETIVVQMIAMGYQQRPEPYDA